MKSEIDDELYIETFFCKESVSPPPELKLNLEAVQGDKVIQDVNIARKPPPIEKTVAAPGDISSAHQMNFYLEHFEKILSEENRNFRDFRFLLDKIKSGKHVLDHLSEMEAMLDIDLQNELQSRSSGSR